MATGGILRAAATDPESMSRPAACLLFATLLLPMARVPAADCAGLDVYRDANGNGHREAGEAGLPGVRVSDGRTFATTDADGRARLARSPAGGTLFVVKPPGSAFARRADGLPDFWRRSGDGKEGDGSCGAIGLSPRRDAENGLQVVVFADPQPKSAIDVGYYDRDIVDSALASGAGAMDLGLSLGDIVDDDLSLYPLVNRATARLGLPWLHAAGNHDLDAAAASDEASLQTFRSVFGPDTLAWEEPEASFVVLDDVIARPGETPGYVGGLRPSQFEFLEAYLATARRERLLVLALHVPLFEAPGRDTFRDADRARLFALLRDFPHVLVLSGHRHAQRHFFHGADSGWQGAKPLHEYGVGAASGAYWSGRKDAEGIPDATMADGTPNGYVTLTVHAGGSYALHWHPARAQADGCIGLHAPKVLRRGAWPGFAVYANVYMGHDGTRVDYRIDDGPWKPMEKVLRPDPRLLAENLRDDESASLRGYDRAPEAEPSPHLWRGQLPTDLPAGEHAIEVRAFDDWRGELRASTRYRLDEATP